MKIKLFLLMPLVLLLVLTVTWSLAFAGPPDDDTRANVQKVSHSSSSPLTHPANLNASDIEAAALGEAGLSFRYVQTFGVNETAYISDTTHLNRPWGLFIDGSNNLYVTEEQGRRVLRYNAGGSATLVIGRAGLSFTDDYVFSQPNDVALDGDGNIWVADDSRVVQYDSNGVIIQSLPARDNNPWESGNDNVRFNGVYGLAFDTAGRMYVSDADNHRVQIYTFAGDGSPVYSTTIGETSVSGSDNTHFDSPQSIAVDGSGQLYVADRYNNRVQRCTFSGSWSCAPFETGLNHPQGVTVAGDNVYIADTENGRIRHCLASSGACDDFATDTYWIYDLAVDSSGNVYGSTAWSAIVIRFDSSGNFLGTFLGAEEVPYLTNSSHYNHPRVAIDNSNNLIVVEENGQRLIKLNSAGTPQWTVGVPGMDTYDDNSHLNWPHGVATDNSGNIYVADGCRVQIFNSGGSYSATIGSSTCGSNNDQFNWASGIAVDSNGNIYVADGDNHRVQIYNSNRIYVDTMGVTGVSGTDKDHFNVPLGLEIDGAGNIYVADGVNCRVQKFNSSRVYQMTLGDTGNCGQGFSQFDVAEDVVVDAQGRIYVADIWNNRVQVFESDGDYLTTIAGNWGSNSGQLRGASSVDIDSSGNVYVSDFTNGRIQKYTPGVPGWTQVNINGFGDVYNRDGAAWGGVLGNQLYMGTSNQATGGELWRSGNGTTWTQVSTDGFGNPNNTRILGLAEFGGSFYAGVYNNVQGGELWRSTNGGTTWNRVTASAGGFGDSNNFEAQPGVVFNNYLYVDTVNETTGSEIWRSNNGDTWTQVNTDGFGDVDNQYGLEQKVFNGYLYIGVWNNADGGQLWRCQTCNGSGSDWAQVGAGSFGGVDNKGVFPMAVYNGYLYVGIFDFAGGQVWRSNNGTTWTEVTPGSGFGNNVMGVSLAAVFNDELYIQAFNEIDGVGIWKTSNGTTWSQVAPDGWGDSNNTGATLTVFNNKLYLGTENYGNGPEVWRLNSGSQVYLPVVIKN